MKTYGTSWCCIDCMMLHANGETPPEMSEDETEAWVAEIQRRSGDLIILCGGEHDEDCPNVDQETGQWIGASDCYCETQEFSWAQCDSCGSRLGGTRHAITYAERS